jgi:hypothetical protein
LTDLLYIVRHVLCHHFLSSLFHGLEEDEVGDRDNSRDLSPSARDKHRIVSKGGSIDRL